MNQFHEFERNAEMVMLFNHEATDDGYGFNYDDVEGSGTLRPESPLNIPSRARMDEAGLLDYDE